MKNTPTSWGPVADWYDHLLSAPDSYQESVILPNLLRLLNPLPGQMMLDLGCGQGFFARACADKGAIITGIDIAPELIERAKKNVPDGTFFVGSAEQLNQLKGNTFDCVFSVLAIQNIKNIPAVFKECQRVLKPRGRLALVLNHPAFRIPKHSSWGWDDTTKQQYRRLDSYLSEITVSIDMHPGQTNSATTTSFHRPLQYYFKLLNNNTFAVTRLEEWISHKTTPHGTRAAAENHSRREFPLFLFLEATKGSV